MVINININIVLITTPKLNNTLVKNKKEPLTKKKDPCTKENRATQKIGLVVTILKFVKIEAILDYLWPIQSLAILAGASDSPRCNLSD